MRTRPIDGKKMIEDSKSKVNLAKKEENSARNLVLKTVGITLGSVALAGTFFYAGGAYNQSIHDRVTNEAKSISIQK